MTVWRRPTNVSNVVISGASHLIVQEAPRQLGKGEALTPAPDRSLG